MRRLDGPVVLIVLDGFGIASPSEGNAVTLAGTPFLKALYATYPHTQLLAAGESVGLPSGQAGNSEVGHINLGAGRIVYQDLLRINLAIENGMFFTNEAFHLALNHAKKNKSNLHLMGLIGQGEVHSSVNHLFALVYLAKQFGITKDKVKIHIFTDGRDSPQMGCLPVVQQMQIKLRSENLGTIASVSGRYYAMDRDNRWERTEKAYDAIASGVGPKSVDPVAVLELSYQNKITDEFIIPTVITDAGGTPIGQVKDNDAIISFNFRPDRVRQITKSFVLKDLAKVPFVKQINDESLDEHKAGTAEVMEKTVSGFDRKYFAKNICFVTMTDYEKKLTVSGIAFEENNIKNPIARVISERELRQVHIAETEKYAHVTYFFNGGREQAFTGEDRVMVPSVKVPTYDMAPAMSAVTITKTFIRTLSQARYHFAVINFANPDMLGHTGNIEKTVESIMLVDECVKTIVQTVSSLNGAVIITSDHGNAEIMIDLQTKQVDTEHNTSPVPAVFVVPEFQGVVRELPSGKLADIAPTALQIMGIPVPSDMTGQSLLNHLRS